MRRFDEDVKYIGSGDYVAVMNESSDGEYVTHGDAEQAAEQAQRRVIAALYWLAGKASMHYRLDRALVLEVTAIALEAAL
jgi:hypothetical protein